MYQSLTFKNESCLLRTLLLILLMFPATIFAQGQQGKFNVLFIIADDMNERCSVLGYPQVKTPNLERLAAHGMVFTNAYSQFPLCNPSRTSILTGWRPNRTLVTDNETSPRSKIGNAVRLMPEYFHDYGYRTERYGKIMHSEFQNECSWDYPVLNNISPDKISNGSKASLSEDGAKPGQWWVTTGKDILKSDYVLCTKLDSSLRTQRLQPFFVRWVYRLPMPLLHRASLPGTLMAKAIIKS
jgi:iduronate 2-sulfatase